MEPNQIPQQQPVQQPEITQGGEKRSLGPIIGIIVVVILLVLGALYVWGGKLSNETDSAENGSAAITASGTPSDDVDSIESDLNAAGEIEIDLSGLDEIQ